MFRFIKLWVNRVQNLYTNTSISCSVLYTGLVQMTKNSMQACISIIVLPTQIHMYQQLFTHPKIATLYLLNIIFPLFPQSLLLLRKNLKGTN